MNSQFLIELLVFILKLIYDFIVQYTSEHVVGYEIKFSARIYH